MEAVTLGTLGLASAFATLGMLLGIVLCIGIGMTAVYAEFIIGQAKLKYLGIKHYADIGRPLLRNFGLYLFSCAACSGRRITLPYRKNRHCRHHKQQHLLLGL